MTAVTLDVRSLSGTMAKILLVFLFERGGMTLEELAYRTGVRDLKTLRLACRDMARPEMGFLVSQSGAHGKETWLPAGALLPKIRQAYFPERGNPPICFENPEIQNGGIPRSAGIKQPELLSENAPERGFPPICLENTSQNGGIPRSAPGSIMMIDESLNHQNQESSIMNPGEKLTVAILLNAVESLFGDTLDPSEVPADSSPELVLSWIVKVYQDRNRLKSPLGLLRARLCAKAPRSLPKDWQDRLPGEFMAAIGLHPQAAQVVASAEPGVDADELEDEPDVSVRISSQHMAWLQLQMQLCAEMPRANYERYVQRVLFIGWEPENSLMLLKSTDPEAAEWFTDRLVTSIQRQLCGLLNQQNVTVKVIAREQP